jgi:GDP-4-dehydro-6-deoxy-D-mannose reductase
MPSRVLVTGAHGFTGRHLVATLRADPHVDVLGTGRSDRPAAGCAAYRPCDFTDDAQVRALVAWAQPDVVYHLAAAWGDAPAATLREVNVAGFERLRLALRPHAGGRTVRMLVVGSAAEIGHVPAAALPVNESVPCHPTTAYGQSKHALVQTALAEPPDSGLEIVVARPFNLLGAGLSQRLAPAAFAAAVAAVARGEARVIRCGWLDGRRDYLDIADAVQAYRLLAEHGRPGDLVNVCSGRSIRTGDLLDRLLAAAGVAAPVEAPPGPTDHDVLDMRGSHALLTTLTGWRPLVELDTSLAAMLASA